MSSQITAAFVRQFGNNVMHLVQQKGSRLKPYVRNESLKGESGFFERIGASGPAAKKTSRHGDTPLTDTPHSKRMVIGSTYHHADMVDNDDKLKMLIDPTSDYVMSFMWMLGRSVDDEIITAADGVALTGKLGDGTQSHGNAFKFGSVNAAADSVAGLNVELLRRLSKALNKSEVEENDRYAAIDADGLEDLLAETEVSSSDYNIVKALVRGDVQSFMGFTFVRTERIGTQGAALSYSYVNGTVGSGSGEANGHSKGLFWQKQGLILATNQEPFAKVAERPDKNHGMQAYVEMTCGAVRMEEERVLVGFYDV